MMSMTMIMMVMVRKRTMPVFNEDDEVCNEDDEGLYHQQQTLCTTPSFVWLRSLLTQNSPGTYGFSRNQKETCYVRTVTKLQLVSSRQTQQPFSSAHTHVFHCSSIFGHCGKELPPPPELCEQFPPTDGSSCAPFRKTLELLRDFKPMVMLPWQINHFGGVSGVWRHDMPKMLVFLLGRYARCLPGRQVSGCIICPAYRCPALPCTFANRHFAGKSQVLTPGPTAEQPPPPPLTDLMYSRFGRFEGRSR